MIFDAADHYWIIGNDEQVYSSARHSFVSADDKNFLAWRSRFDKAVTRIASAVELAEVLSQNGVVVGPGLPKPTTPILAESQKLAPTLKHYAEKFATLEARLAALEDKTK